MAAPSATPPSFGQKLQTFATGWQLATAFVGLLVGGTVAAVSMDNRVKALERSIAQMGIDRTADENARIAEREKLQSSIDAMKETLGDIRDRLARVETKLEK